MHLRFLYCSVTILRTNTYIHTQIFTQIVVLTARVLLADKTKISPISIRLRTTRSINEHDFDETLYNSVTQGRIAMTSSAYLKGMLQIDIWMIVLIVLFGIHSDLKLDIVRVFMRSFDCFKCFASFRLFVYFDFDFFFNAFFEFMISTDLRPFHS